MGKELMSPFLDSLVMLGYSPIEWEGLGGVEPMGMDGRRLFFANGTSAKHQASSYFDADLGVTWTDEPEDKGFDTFRENEIFLPQPTGFRMSGGLSVWKF